MLIGDARNMQEFCGMLSDKPLLRPGIWLGEGMRSQNGILLDRMQRFKGPESAVVVLCGLESSLSDAQDELLFVGISRANSVCHAVSQSSARRCFEART